MADDTEIVNDHAESDLKNTLSAAEGEENFSSLNENSELKSSENKDCLSPKVSSDPTLNETNSPNRVASPEPPCSICLGKLQNKSFTDSCYHTFCFGCLLEWSKVKAECPLCKVRFKSIVHNVRSIQDYDQYYIAARSSSRTTWRSPTRQRFRYRSTMTRENEYDRHRRIDLTVALQLQSHRSMYAPHAVHARPRVHPSTQDTRRSPRNINFRRHIYRENLWAIRPSGRTRHAYPEFYRSNPACTHRLIPWLTRELTVLLNNNEHKVGFVLDFIMSLILRYNIQSQEFYLHTQSYLGDRTSHFVHEFYSFASSVFDSDEYDNHVLYAPAGSSASLDIFSSPEDDVIALPSSNSENEEDQTIARVSSTLSNSSSHRTSPFHKYRSLIDASRRRKQKPITKLYLKRNQESNSWDVLPSPSQTTPSLPGVSDSPIDLSASVSAVFDDPDPGPSSSMSTFFEEPIPSTSGSAMPRRRNSSCESTNASMSIILSSGDDNDDDDCVIVDEVKPRWLRTPEVVDLSSDPDQDKPLNLADLLDSVSEGSFLSFSTDLSDNEFLMYDKSPSVLTGVPLIPDSSQTSNNGGSVKYDGSKEPVASYSRHRTKRHHHEKSKTKHSHVSKRKSSHSSRSRYHRRNSFRWSSSSSRSRDRGSRGRDSRSWSHDSAPHSHVHPFLKDLVQERKPKSWSLEENTHVTLPDRGENPHNFQSFNSSTSLEHDTRNLSYDSSSAKKVRMRSVISHAPKSHHRSESSQSSFSGSKKNKEKRRKKRKHDKHKHSRHSTHSKERRS